MPLTLEPDFLFTPMSPGKLSVCRTEGSPGYAPDPPLPGPGC